MPESTGFSELVSIVSAATALAAVIVSPWISWRVAERQISASNVSAKRQAWIDELRKEVSETLALISRIQELKRADPRLSRDEQLALFDQRADAELRVAELLMRIRLRLNPKESDHIELLTAFRTLSNSAPDPAPNETNEDREKLKKKFFEARDVVLVITQKILKNEWNRVRAGE
jgi:hypothetical protein